MILYTRGWLQFSRYLRHQGGYCHHPKYAGAEAKRGSQRLDRAGQGQEGEEEPAAGEPEAEPPHRLPGGSNHRAPGRAQAGKLKCVDDVGDGGGGDGDGDGGDDISVSKDCVLGARLFVQDAEHHRHHTGDDEAGGEQRQ